MGSLNDDSSSSQTDVSRPQIQGFVLQTPRKIGVPELQNADGTVFDNAALTGKWSLLFYGYTHCPDICPTTLSTVAAARQEALSRPIDFPQVIFISVDPKRDDAELVGEYVRYFDESFIGVTGEERMLQAMAQQMSVAAMVVPSDKPGEYLVDHSSNLMLINPQAELVAMLRPPHTVQSILDSISKVMQ